MATVVGTPQEGVCVKRVASAGNAGRIYVSKALVGKLVQITPISQDVNPRDLIEAVFGKKLTDLLVGKQEESSSEPQPSTW